MKGRDHHTEQPQVTVSDWYHPFVIGWSMGWDCASRNALCARVTTGDLRHFTEATDSSLEQP